MAAHGQERADGLWGGRRQPWNNSHGVKSCIWAQQRQLLATIGVPAFLRAQSNPVVMLGIWPFTGGLADSGPHLNNGMQMAIDEWGGEVIGRPIKYITRDDETKAGSATRRVEEAIDSEQVKFVIGPWSSGVAGGR